MFGSWYSSPRRGASAALGSAELDMDCMHRWTTVLLSRPGIPGCVAVSVLLHSALTRRSWNVNVDHVSLPSL